MDFVIPPSAPFSSGIDAAEFKLHYEQSMQEKKLRLKQRVFNFWYYYFAPIALGMIPGKLLGDYFFPAATNDAMWTIVVYGSCLVISPAVMVWRRKNKSHRRFQVFYSESIERCIEGEGANKSCR